MYSLLTANGWDDKSSAYSQSVWKMGEDDDDDEIGEEEREWEKDDETLTMWLDGAHVRSSIEDISQSKMNL